MIRDLLDEKGNQFINFNYLDRKKVPTLLSGLYSFRQDDYFLFNMNSTASAAFTNPPVIHVSIISPDFFALGI